jgi:hypothetical protein
MPNRREFLQTGAVVSAFAVNGLLVRDAAALGAARDRVTLHKVIYDDRYADVRDFAATVAQRGIALAALDAGDVTRIFDELDVLWRSQPFAIAGTTQFGPMLVLEQLGVERGLRMALRVEHRLQADGTLAHSVTAAEETLALANALGASDFAWPVAMAALACGCASPGDAPERTVALAFGGAQPELQRAGAEPPASASFIHYYTPRDVQQGYGPAVDGPLYSWVIAPTLRG